MSKDFHFRSHRARWDDLTNNYDLSGTTCDECGADGEPWQIYEGCDCCQHCCDCMASDCNCDACKERRLVS